MKHFYPAIFRPKANNPTSYDVNVIDIPSVLTHGDNIFECMEMAQDAIGVMLEDVLEEN